MILLQSIWENVWIALILFIFVWVYGWAKGNLGSTKLAILFALIIVYLTFYSFPELVWIAVGIFLLATFGKDIIDKVNPFKERGIDAGYGG